MKSDKAFRLIDTLKESSTQLPKNIPTFTEKQSPPCDAKKSGRGAVPGEMKTSLAQAEITEGEGRLSDAIRKSMELLGYGAMSQKKLIQKLTLRGFEPDVAMAAAAYLRSRGLLPETEDAVRFAEQGVRKLWGPRRIKEDLYARGFTAEAIDTAMDSLSRVDFVANCAKVISKKYGYLSEDPREAKKMVASLMRMGYTASQIKAAISQ